MGSELTSGIKREKKKFALTTDHQTPGIKLLTQPQWHKKSEKAFDHITKQCLASIKHQAPILRLNQLGIKREKRNLLTSPMRAV